MILTRDMMKTWTLAFAIAVGAIVRCDVAQAAPAEKLVVAGGCFWCVESDFESVDGVIEAVSGFTGGNLADPSYRDVVSGGTGHFEAVEISFDPDVVSRQKLLNLFFRSVDPTDKGGQFCDRGPTYRTAIFVSSDAEEALAKKAKRQAGNVLQRRIVTPILPLGEFYPADAYHQDYYKQDKIIVTRFGPRKKSVAYKKYRDACGRDARTKDLWGDQAVFATGKKGS
jgi:peptide-methionine (S)-S-oxide reductase